MRDPRAILSYYCYHTLAAGTEQSALASLHSTSVYCFLMHEQPSMLPLLLQGAAATMCPLICMSHAACALLVHRWQPVNGSLCP